MSPNKPKIVPKGILGTVSSSHPKCSQNGLKRSPDVPSNTIKIVFWAPVKECQIIPKVRQDESRMVFFDTLKQISNTYFRC